MKSVIQVCVAGLSAIAALFLSMELAAQQYAFHQYGPAEGLTNLSVNCLFQDRTGYLWVGTDNGLFRFDGVSFQAFGHAEGLANTEIRGLAESPRGVLWVATQGGVARHLGSRFESVDVGEQGMFEGIAFDSVGRMYLEHTSGILRGLPVLANSKRSDSYHFTTVAQGAVGGMYVNGEDVWFRKDGDIWYLKEDRTERIGTPAGLPLDLWDAITQDTQGNLWVRSAARLYELPSGQARFVDRSDGIPHSSRSRLYSDRHGRLFVSTSFGVVLVDGARRTYIDPPHGLPADVAGSVLVDRSESLWMGMLGGGLIRRLGHDEWLSWKKEDGLLNDSVWSVLHDRAGRLWVGTSGGLSIFGPGGTLAHSWTTRNGLAGDRVLAIAESPTGDFFTGTDPVGISRFDKEGNFLQTYGPTSGLTLELVSALAIDQQSRLWAIGTGGCFRSRTPIGGLQLKFERMEIPGLPSRTLFREMLIDEFGVVWITSSNGLIRYDGSHWTVFTKGNGFKSPDLAAIAQGPNALWVSYRDALGFARLQVHGDQVAAVNTDVQDGLSSDLVYALAFDHTGRLWVSTDNGVDVLDQGRWRQYGREDGLIWDDGDDEALSVDPQGNIWIGTSQGLSRYAQSPFLTPDSPSIVVLTLIQGASQEFQPEDHPVLPHTQNSVLFQFSGLNYFSAARTRFRYRLLGHESRWTETRERSVRFESLTGGDYIFEVVAAGQNGLWSPVPARFAFSVKPPWWLSWWFLATCVMMIMLLARGVWQFRVRVLVAQKKLLEQQVIDRTAELRESHRQLEEIAYYDMLTTLPNRRMFTEQFRARLALARRHGSPFALMLVDLDRFKITNDSFGHDAGDAVLIESAIMLRAAVRESDCVARLGGDEFAILLIGLDDPIGIEMVCKRIVDGFASGIPYNDSTLNASCSVGIALFPADGDTQERLYKSADMALYEAKRLGGNTCCRYRHELAELTAQPFPSSSEAEEH
jgi:diguanylate cyclase (GGDEF)-like protein